MAASSTSLIQLPTVAVVDGWELQSSSINQPTEAEVIERLTDAPPADKTPEAKPEPEQPPPAREAEAAETTPPADEPAKDKKKSATDRNAELRARIGYETRQYHEARRAREAEEQELTRLRQEKEALAKPAEKEKKGGESTKAELENRPVWSQFEAEGKSYDDFVEARSEWDRAQTVEAARIALQAETRQRQSAEYEARAAAAHEKRINDAIEKHPDFLEVVNQNLSDVPDSPFMVDMVQRHAQGAEVLYHFAQHPDEARVLSTITPSRPMYEGIRTSDNPVAVLSYFAQHPQEFDRLNRLHPASALVALGELTARLKGANDGSPSAETVSNAKPPLRPVVGGRTSVPKDIDAMEFGPEWIRAENQRERERRKAGRF